MSVRLIHLAPPSPGVLKSLRAILEKEGMRSLFRGLGPNLVGVAPSRAIYFAAYSGVKERLNAVLVPESKKVHMLSAACAGVTSATLTNPIWLVKTRMQLEARVKGELGGNALQCAMRVYRTEGLHGFYRGISASYAGVSETIIHFVIYEELKQQLRNSCHSLSPPLGLPPNSRDFFGLMGAAAVSKTCASCIAYPHEVIRTRLREEGSRYRSFVQTLQLVVHEEGPLALYRGLLAHLIRQIPNTAIMMATYELVVHLTSSTLKRRATTSLRSAGAITLQAGIPGVKYTFMLVKELDLEKRWTKQRIWPVSTDDILYVWKEPYFFCNQRIHFATCITFFCHSLGCLLFPYGFLDPMRWEATLSLQREYFDPLKEQGGCVFSYSNTRAHTHTNIIFHRDMAII
nr:PREDICTED: solute carrier family 25 member 36-like isoform X2 [Apteryx mantelli mantelli]